MTTAALTNALTFRRFLPPEFEVRLSWSWHDWTCGYVGEHADLGMTALVLGPLMVHFDWAIA